jgi:uncharacterized protein with PIN domain
VISSEPRFIADRMLGRLARYLRLMGHDVSYPPPSSDARLVAMARAEDRVLLTRDHGISLREGPRDGNPVVVEISSCEIMEQLAQLVEAGWVTRFLAPRCSLCNARLEALEEREARHLLPPFTLATHCLYLYCGSCNIVLWEGSHWEHFRNRTMPTVDLS